MAVDPYFKRLSDLVSTFMFLASMAAAVALILCITFPSISLELAGISEGGRC